MSSNNVAKKLADRLNDAFKKVDKCDEKYVELYTSRFRYNDKKKLINTLSHMANDYMETVTIIENSYNEMLMGLNDGKLSTQDFINVFRSLKVNRGCEAFLDEVTNPNEAQWMLENIAGYLRVHGMECAQRANYLNR